MQNSLNQAFIRAYAKERNANHSQAASTAADEQAAINRANAELILRVDTATVDIPRPHLAARNPARQNKAVPAMATAVAAQQSRVALDEDDIRATIASEMLRAGSWQSEQIASLGPIAIGPMNAATPLSAAASNPTVNENTVRQNITPSAGPVASIAEEAEPVRSSFATKSAAADGGSAASYVREPATRRLYDSPPVAKTGSIVRLDKPLGHVAKDETLKPASQAIDNAKPQPWTAPAIATKAKSNLAAEAKQVERALRQAKVRVFNPIWEVDQLQWPEVCVKLMQARMDSLSHVTQHLAEACQEGLQVLAVTSPEGGEGRTTVACCLAMLAGSRGLKVAILDGDIENPTLSLQTNLEIENDWQAAIINDLPLEEVAVHSIDDQITLVPLLSPIDQSQLPSSDQRIADMVNELAESFDLVIVDIGHMNSPNGLMYSLAEQGIINAAIAVIDNRIASSQRVETCIRRIRQAGVSSIGLVENFAA